MHFLKKVAVLALFLPAWVSAAPASPAVAAPAAKPAPAPITPMPAPAADVTRLPPETVGEAEMRAQLEQVRALNAQLRAEREQLQEQLAKVQAEVTAEDKRLKQATLAAAQSEAAAQAGAGSNLYLYAGGTLGVVLLGAVLWRVRGRKAAGTA